MTLINLPIYLAIAGFIFMGLGSFIFPERVTAQFDIPKLTMNGKNEVRAVYGGFGILMGVMLIIAIYIPDLRSGICLTVAAALTGMAIGRLISFIIDRNIGRFPCFYMGLETLFAVILAFAA